MNLEFICSYIPHGLRFYDTRFKIIHNIVGIIQDEIYAIDKNDDDVYSWYYKESDKLPILKPISDLFNGEYEHILDEFSDLELENFKHTFLSKLRPKNAMDFISHSQFEALVKEHFDVYDLIRQNLAININEIE